MDYLPRKIVVSGEEEGKESIVISKHHLDCNDHVNNGRYVKEAMDYLPNDRVLKQMRVDYRKAAALGDKMYPVQYQKEELYQVAFVDETGSPYVIVEVV